jgi:hypothetical protein
MSREDMALVQGWADTKLALNTWRRKPSTVFVPWVRWSFCVAVLLLTGTWVVSLLAVADPGGLQFAGVTDKADLGDYGFVLLRNSLVLALHALACVAGFIAGSSLPKIADSYSGWFRKMHQLAKPLAIGFVVCATLFSLVTQAYILGHDSASLAAQWRISSAELLGILSLHAIPELIALFLPLAAWTMASRKGEWENLLAATFATLTVSIPLILVAAAIEVWVTPHVLLQVVHPMHTATLYFVK